MRYPAEFHDATTVLRLAIDYRTWKVVSNKAMLLHWLRAKPEIAMISKENYSYYRYNDIRLSCTDYSMEQRRQHSRCQEYIVHPPQALGHLIRRLQFDMTLTFTEWRRPGRTVACQKFWLPSSGQHLTKPSAHHLSIVKSPTTRYNIGSLSEYSSHVINTSFASLARVGRLAFGAAYSR